MEIKIKTFAALERRVEERGGGVGDGYCEFALRLPNVDGDIDVIELAHGYLNYLDLREKARELCRRYDEAVADFQGVVNCEAAIPVSVVRQAFGIEEEK